MTDKEILNGSTALLRTPLGGLRRAGGTDRLRCGDLAPRLADPLVVEDHLRRVITQMLWSVTEADGKYTTRYRSVGTLALEQDVRADRWWSLLRHDHVLTRKKLALRLRAGEDPAAVLSDAILCTVTKDEHDRLSEHDATLSGWARYRAASVEVVDMRTGDPLDLEGRWRPHLKVLEHVFEYLQQVAPPVDWHPRRLARATEWTLWVPGQPEPIAVVRVVTIDRQSAYRAVSWAPRSSDRTLIGYYPDGDAAAEACWHRYVALNRSRYDAASRLHGSMDRGGPAVSDQS